MGSDYDPHFVERLRQEQRTLTDDELLRGLEAVQRLETAWFLDPAPVEDLKRLHLIRMQVRSGRVQLGDLGWLRDRIGETA